MIGDHLRWNKILSWKTISFVSSEKQQTHVIISKYLHKFQDHDENAGLKFPPSRGESESRKEGGGVEEVKEQERGRGLHVKGVCLRVVSNSTFETWSQLYQSSELYQKSEPGQKNSEIDQKSELPQNSENKQLVKRVGSSERLLKDATGQKGKKNESEKSLNNGVGLNSQRDYYNFQIISQV